MLSADDDRLQTTRCHAGKACSSGNKRASCMSHWKHREKVLQHKQTTGCVTLQSWTSYLLNLQDLYLGLQALLQQLSAVIVQLKCCLHLFLHHHLQCSSCFMSNSHLGCTFLLNVYINEYIHIPCCDCGQDTCRPVAPPSAV